MAQYEQYRGSVPSRSSKQEAPLENERRAPIRPRENMKDIIYNGVGVGEEGRVGSRVVCLISSGIILTSRLTVTIIIPPETDLIFTLNITHTIHQRPVIHWRWSICLGSLKVFLSLSCCPVLIAIMISLKACWFSYIYACLSLHL